MGVRCGGAVERHRKMPKAVNLLNMNQRMMKMMKKIRMEMQYSLKD